MSADEQIATPVETATDSIVELDRSEKILKAKELYSHGSRNYLVKSYTEAADELSQVCALYEELHGELSDELGMPYLLYAKSLIALALDENKVVDVPDQEEDDDDDEDDDDETEAEAEGNNETSAITPASDATNKLESIKELKEVKHTDVADSTADTAAVAKSKKDEINPIDESVVSSTEEDRANAKTSNGIVDDDEKPGTSNGKTENIEGAGGEIADEDDENEAASNLQLAWEILELSAKIFSRQGLSGLSNLAEVKTELANIEFENNILDAAREDYEKALKIYDDLTNNYRRARAEIHYKIGLTYLMQQSNKEGADSLKQACVLIEQEIEEIKAKPEPTEKDKNTIQDLEETKQEIWVKISEIEETEAQTVAEVRAALDSYIKPLAATETAISTSETDVTVRSTPSSTLAVSSSSKPTDISHLIKRKKPEEPNSEAEAASPAKRTAL